MIEDILKYLGIDVEKAKDIDGFKKEFTGNFYSKKALDNQKSDEFRDIFSKVTGKFTGKYTSRIQSKLKSLGIKDDDMKDQFGENKDFEDVIDLAMDKINASQLEKIKTLEENLKKGNDEKTKELSEINGKLLQKTKDLESLLETTKKSLNDQIINSQNEKKAMRMDQFRKDLFEKIRWSDDAKKNPLIQKGFITSVNENLVFDIDEKDNLVVHNKEGKLIPNLKKNGEFLSPIEAIEDLANKENVWQANPHQGGTQFQFNISQQQQQQQQQSFIPPRHGQIRKMAKRINN